MDPAVAADLIVVVHFAFVLWVILGQLAILAGALRRWRWVRNRWFRVAHLASILFVALQALFERLCPLTTWEHELRREAGQEFDGNASFMGRVTHELLFVEAPEHVLTIVYVAFALLVVATLFLVPPRWRAGARE